MKPKEIYILLENYKDESSTIIGTATTEPTGIVMLEHYKEYCLWNERTKIQYVGKGWYEFENGNILRLEKHILYNQHNVKQTFCKAYQAPNKEQSLW